MRDIRHYWILFPASGGMKLSYTSAPLLQRKGKCESFEDCKKQIEQFLEVYGIKIAPKRANIFG